MFFKEDSKMSAPTISAVLPHCGNGVGGVYIPGFLGGINEECLQSVSILTRVTQDMMVLPVAHLKQADNNIFGQQQ